MNHSGKSPRTGWDVHTCRFSGADLVPARFEIQAPYFICLLNWDAVGVSDAQIDALARRLLDAGAVMLCCHGEDCARVCERFAAVIGGREEGVARLEISAQALHGSVHEAVAFVLDEACPALRYLTRCGAVLALVIDVDPCRLAMVELAISLHSLRGTEPPGAS